MWAKLTAWEEYDVLINLDNVTNIMSHNTGGSIIDFIDESHIHVIENVDELTNLLTPYIVKWPDD